MSDFEHELLDLLEKDGKFDPAREEVLRLQITSEFKRKKRQLLIWNVVMHIILIIVVLPGLNLIFGGFPDNHISNNDPRLSDPGFLLSAIVSETRAAAQGTAIITLAAAGLIVIKLWYWIVHGRLEVVRELKRLELRWTLDRQNSQIQQGGGDQ